MERYDRINTTPNGTDASAEGRPALAGSTAGRWGAQKAGRRGEWRVTHSNRSDFYTGGGERWARTYAAVLNAYDDHRQP